MQMTASITSVEAEHDQYNRKDILYVRTDSDKTYVFERFSDSHRPARLARRGRGPQGLKDLSKRRSRIPRNVERVADAEYDDTGWQL